MRILVVDDHPGFRRQARLMLEEAGYDVVGEVGDGATAIGTARELHPDVVLLDIGLPDHDGFSVATVLAAEAVPPAVVLISGREMDDGDARVAACGARGFLAKAHLSPESLHASLEHRAAS